LEFFAYKIKFLQHLLFLIFFRAVEEILNHLLNNFFLHFQKSFFYFKNSQKFFFFSSFLFSQCPNILVRHLISKLLQRISLVLLRPKLASWRYRCGYRSIEETLKRDKNLKMDSASSLQGFYL